MTIGDRFKEERDRVEALEAQAIVNGDKGIATAFAAEGELIELEPGQNLIEQGSADRSIYFLLAGKVRVIINQLRMHTRAAGVTVGEMSAINPANPRSATLEAEEDTVAWKVSHKRLAEIADEHHIVWKRLAIDLAGRLEQRNSYVNRANMQPRIFMICSREAKPIATAIRVGLRYVTPYITIWSDEEIFESGSYPLEALQKEVQHSDFAIALAEPDDIIRSRDRTEMTVRDNVIFELGYFMSRLGRDRTLLLVPSGEDVKLPSDFKGLTPIPYNKGNGKELPVTMGPAIDQIAHKIEKKGVRSSLVEAS